MQKLLVICGPTASGKTALGLFLAELFDGELVSADSRQVYKGMDVGTGKDLPLNARFIFKNPKIGGYYQIKETKIWGYDLISPKESFSVAQYTKVARRIIKDIHKRNKLPILVGGTGLYIKSIIEGIPTVDIPRNENLRNNLKEKSVNELYENLALLDPVKAASLNSSDRKNPRRLVRAMEVATWKLDFGEPKQSSKVKKYDVLSIGLKAEREILAGKIEERLENMVDGVKREIKKLLSDGVTREFQSMSSLGYRQWRDYFEGSKKEKEVFLDWVSEEKKYAKRQLSWFKKQKEVNWFDIACENWQKKVEILVKKWYKQKDA